MFRKEFADVISSTGMIPLKDLRPYLQNQEDNEITELELLKLDFFDPNKFAQTVAQNYKLTFIDLSKAKIKDEHLGMIKRADIIKYRSIPVNKTGKVVTLAIYDPTITEFEPELHKLFHQNIEFFLVDLVTWKQIYGRVEESIEELVATIKEIKSDTTKVEEEVSEKDIGQDIITYVNQILAEAFIKKASDIHIEPYEKSFRVRLRIDGTLVESARPPKSMMLPMISRLKIMASMDISEKRKPQDGRIKLSIGGLPIDYRVSSLPTLFGEKIVLRLLDSSNLQLDMTKLGFEQKQMENFKEGIHRPFGMCLVTGPTGSGKTTTLYSAMADLNKPTKNISTAEDPVEFNLEGINQVNIRKEAGLTFASALKAFLRQDPDIIMVGEIRDLEVAEIAVEAALTGHMVLSTLHTNDACATVTRLLNMGIEPFLVTGALTVVVAQRLCRRICSECKTDDTDITIDAMVSCGIAASSAQKLKPKKGSGCSHCNNTGYKGRVAIYEVLSMSPGVKEMVLKSASSDEIKKQAIRDGMKTLRMSALTKFAQGLTTLAEVVSNSSPDKF